MVGLGFGDEGKGLVTDYLCCRSKLPLVIRYNGGHQAGHTVVTEEGQRHVFSSFGAGTLRNIPTYWSKYCTFSPIYLLNECRKLKTRPLLFVDARCPVNTHYDVLYNQAIEATRGSKKHGSCGVGFGATIERHYEAGIKLCANELLSSRHIRKLKAIRSFYEAKFEQETKFSFSLFEHDAEDEKFMRSVEELNALIAQDIVTIVNENDIFSSARNWETLIFEGAQGVLLDMDFGSFPHVTRSNTTSKNALNLLRCHFDESALDIEIFYVTRAYQTRHGAGPFPEYSALKLVNTEFETNQSNEHQGDFKVGYLDIDLLNYAISCDEHFSSELKKHLIVTCLDQFATRYIPVLRNGTLDKIDYRILPDLLECKLSSCKFSFSSCSKDM